jgi:hypothetical protein
MEQINKLETIFAEGSFTDRLNALETSLLRGGTSSLDFKCTPGLICQVGGDECDSGVFCNVGEGM